MAGGIDPAASGATMLRAFASVGTTCFDVTWTDADGEKQQFRRGVMLDRLGEALSIVLAGAERQRRNLIVRPNVPPVLLQLDDLDADKLSRVRAASFLALATSPGNYQSWIALSAPADDDFARRVRKATGADPTASGATRVAGSLNFKPKHAPDFPRVAIECVQPGLTVSPSELEAQGLVAARETSSVVRATRAWPGARMRKWPDYGKCLDGAPANHSGNGPDVSRADFTFAMIAADWGWSIEDIAGRLSEESLKAQENGPRYAMTTAVKAAEAAARRAGKTRLPTPRASAGVHGCTTAEMRE